MTYARSSKLLADICFALLLTMATPPARAQTAPATQSVTSRDGSKDFEWETGSWATHVRVLRNPLSSNSNWIEFRGTSTVRPLLGGSSNVVELDVSNPSARLRGVSLRLYNVEARQWTLHFANMGDGVLTPPMTGEFKDGRGEFHGLDTLRRRTILVRFVISEITANSARFEQSYSDDGGKSWELNWVAVDTRLPGKP